MKKTPKRPQVNEPLPPTRVAVRDPFDRALLVALQNGWQQADDEDTVTQHDEAPPPCL